MNTNETVSKTRVALVTNMVAPYRVSFYNALADRCDLVVLVDTESEFNRAWKLDESEFRFRRVVMQSASLVLPRVRKDVGYREQRQMHFSQRVFGLLRKEDPDVVISNERGLRSLWSWLYARTHGKPWILTSEATDHTEGWVGMAKRLLRRFLIAAADGYWSNGLETNRFLERRGARSDTITSGMTGIDTSDFEARSAEASQVRDQLRSELGLKGVVFLFAGRLDEGKGLRPFADAVDRIAERLSGRASFLFVGDGALREELAARLAVHPGIASVFTGFVQPANLPRYFAIGDVFLMPTLDDNWPLVNLEAMAAGLPQLYSVFNGGAPDMNEDAGIGAAFDPRDVELFAQRLLGCVDAPPPRVADSVRRRVLDYYSPESQAERAITTVRRVLRA